MHEKRATSYSPVKKDRQMSENAFSNQCLYLKEEPFTSTSKKHYAGKDKDDVVIQASSVTAVQCTVHVHKHTRHHQYC